MLRKLLVLALAWKDGGHDLDSVVAARYVTFTKYYCSKGGLGSSVGIATGYRLDSPGIKSRWGARFSAPVQTGPGAHPASCTMGTRSFAGIKSSRGMTLTPNLLLVLWSRKSSTPPMGRMACTEPQCLYKGAPYLTVLRCSVG